MANNYKQLKKTTDNCKPLVTLINKNRLDYKNKRGLFLDKTGSKNNALEVNFEDKLHKKPFSALNVHLDYAKDYTKEIKAYQKNQINKDVFTVIAGDTNMRVAEDEFAENGDGGLGMKDLWKMAGSDVRTKYTVSLLDCPSFRTVGQLRTECC